MTDIDSAINMFDSIAEELKFEKICELSSKEKKNYNYLLNELIRTNSSSCTTKEKEDALDKIATFVLNSGNIFEVYNNIRTSTNELDQLIRTNIKGKLLSSRGLIDNRLNNFIGECKNYNSKVSVTYVGKICSLLTTTQNKICIIFSYHGISGNGWNNSKGLIKKFYLSKENQKERFCIIDFNINDFIAIKEGKNILQIIHDKIMAMQNDTDYIKFMRPHEKEILIEEIQKKE